MQDLFCDITAKARTHEALIKKLKESGTLNFFLLNIDNFSNINNAYGYEVGTAVLYEFVKYLEIAKPETSLMYSCYSDKFVLIDERELDDTELLSIAEAILSFFSQVEFVVQDIEMRISLSIGISKDSGLINISKAETAIEELRKAKRNHCLIFNENSEFVKIKNSSRF